MRSIEYRSIQAQQSSMAWHDALTGLPNRTALFSQLAHVMARHQSGALIMIDLTDFAGINQAHGHLAGDQMLRQAGKAIVNCLRARDLVARWHSDEFCIYRPGRANTQQLIKLCHRLAAGLQQIDRKPGPLSANMGVAVFPGDADDSENLVARADIALRQAKRHNRLVRFFDAQLSQHILKWHNYEMQQHDALAQEQFEVFYQPQFRVADRRLIGAEALLRWRHPEDGLLMPVDFLPTLENSAMASPVGNWVLRTACAQASRWRATYNRDLAIGVNLFGQQLQMGGLVTAVTRILAETGLPAHALELEITENIILHNRESEIAPLWRLRQAGIGVAFDDYGTGYASLSLLKHYPLSRLKIDRSFVRDMTSDATDRALVQAIVDLGANFNLRVTAEGVETDEQLALLHQAGCREAQGYLISRPVPADEFARRFLGAHNLAG